MRKIFFLLTIAFFVFLSGCIYVPVSSISALSRDDEKPFYDLQDKELQLVRPIKIYGDILWSALDDKTVDSAIVNGIIAKITFPKVNGENAVIEYHKVPKELPKGTMIKFDYRSFRVHKEYSFFIPCKIRYVATFKVIGNPDISSDLEFEYIWGRGLYLNRAPWEDESVPESRYVGFNGKSYSGD